MIKIGCQINVYGYDKISSNFEQIAENIAANGYAGIECGIRFLDQAKKGFYKDLLHRLGLAVTALHIGGNFLEPDKAAEESNKILNAAELARFLGARYVFISGGYSPQNTTMTYYNQASNYNQLGAACKQLGISLLYHNHNWEIWDDCSGLEILLNNTSPENINLVPDLGWVRMGGFDPAAFCLKYNSRISALHFKDFHVPELQAGISAGSLDYKSLKTSELARQATELGTGLIDYAPVGSIFADRENFWVVAEQDYSLRNPAESSLMNYQYIASVFGNRS